MKGRKIFLLFLLLCISLPNCKRKKLNAEDIDLSLNVLSELFKISFAIVPINLFLSYLTTAENAKEIKDCVYISEGEKEKTISLNNCSISQFVIRGNVNIKKAEKNIFYLQNISLSISDGPIFLDNGYFKIEKIEGKGIAVKEGSFYFLPFESNEVKIKYDIADVYLLYEIRGNKIKFHIDLTPVSKIKGENEREGKYNSIESISKKSFFSIDFTSANIHLIDVKTKLNLNISGCGNKNYDIKIEGDFTFDFQTFFLGYLCPIKGYISLNSSKIKISRYRLIYSKQEKSCMNIQKCL